MSGIVGGINLRSSGLVNISSASDGQIYTGTGAGLPVGFEAAAGGGKLLAMFHNTSALGSTTVGTTVGTWYDTAITLTFTPTSTASKFLVYYGHGHSIEDAGTDGGFGRRIKKVQDAATTYPAFLQDYIGSGNLHSSVYWYPGGITGTGRKNFYMTFCGVDADAHSTNSLVYTLQAGQYNITVGGETLNIGDYYAARSQFVVLEISTA